MALIQLVNIGSSGDAKKNLPWNAYNETWDKKSLSLAGQASGYMTCMGISPKIVEGCYVSATFSTSGNIAQYIQVSTDGNTWSTLGNYIMGSGTITRSLVNYIGHKIYVRISCGNYEASASRTSYLTACIVNV